MLNKLVIKIDNLIDLSENYNVIVDEKVLSMRKCDNTVEYNYFTHNKKCKVCIFADDIWSVDNSIEKKFSWLSIFDFEFGNTFENLPVSSQFERTLYFEKNREVSLELHQQDFINVDKYSLLHWNRCSIIQILLCVLLLFIVFLLLGTIFKLFYIKLFYYIFSLLCVISLFIIMNKKRKKVYKQLLYNFVL